MTTSVARQDRTVPAIPQRPPQLSNGLARAIDQASNPHPDLGSRDAMLTAFQRQEAERVMDRYDFLALPALPDRIMAWLVGVNAGMGHPLDKAEFVGRASEIVNALSDLPADAFTAKSRIEAQKAFKFFPGVAELHSLLKPYAAVLLKRAALRRLLDANQVAETREQLTTEQRAEIVSDFQRKMEVMRRELPSEREIGKVLSRPSPLTHEQLVSVYVAQLRQAEAADNVLAKNIALTRLHKLEPQEVF